MIITHLTNYKLGDPVVRSNGEDAGRVIAIIVPSALRKPTRLRVQTPDGKVYEATETSMRRKEP